MNNNFDEYNEEDYQPQHMTSHNNQHNHSRNVIEIPVQHIKSTSPNPGVQSQSNGQHQAPHHSHFPPEKFKNQDFFRTNPSIFDDFNSPFDSKFF
jgi:hypothetical protein